MFNTYRIDRFPLSTSTALNCTTVQSIWLFTFFLSAALFLRWSYWYYKAYKEFPGPPLRSIWIGNLNETMADDVHEKWRHWHRKYGKVFQTWNGPFSRIVYIGDPSMIAKIATANWPKSPAQYEGFKPLSGDALFVQMNHARWRAQRKSLAPAFQPQVIREQYPSLVKHLLNYIGTIDQAASNGGVVDLSILHVLLTLDFVGEVAFGTDLHALSEGLECRIMKIFDTVLPELMKCGLFPLRAKFPVLKSTRDMHKAIRELRSLADKAVDNARSVEKEGAAEKRIFEILARHREPGGDYLFSRKELRDNYVTFLVAGGDPTAHTITFAVYEVLRNPIVLSRVRAEVDDAIPNKDAIPSLDQVKLPYLNIVIKETLRYNGPGFGTFRYCKKRTEVEGVMIPANTTLALWNPQVHRDPSIWGRDADSFDPERWAQDGPEKIRGSYFPFSYGPRNCLGQGLAMLEMSLTLATLFRRYDMSFAEGFEMEYLPSFTLCAKNGLKVCVKIRET